MCGEARESLIIQFGNLVAFLRSLLQKDTVMSHTADLVHDSKWVSHSPAPCTSQAADISPNIFGRACHSMTACRNRFHREAPLGNPELGPLGNRVRQILELLTINAAPTLRILDSHGTLRYL